MSATSKSGITEGFAQSTVGPIVVTLTVADHLESATLAGYHTKIATKIEAAGIPLGPMIWLAFVRDMTPEEIDRKWISELSQHNIARVDVERTPALETRIYLWTNDKRSEPAPETYEKH